MQRYLKLYNKSKFEMNSENVLVTEKICTIHLDDTPVDDLISELNKLKDQHSNSYKRLIIRNDEDLYESYYNLSLYGVRDENEKEKLVRILRQKEIDNRDYQTYLKLKSKFE